MAVSRKGSPATPARTGRSEGESNAPRPSLTAARTGGAGREACTPDDRRRSRMREWRRCRKLTCPFEDMTLGQWHSKATDLLAALPSSVHKTAVLSRLCCHWSTWSSRTRCKAWRLRGSVVHHVFGHGRGPDVIHWPRPRGGVDAAGGFQFRPGDRGDTAL
eukprot:2718395-Prymnesium_polylepis.2